MVFGNNYDTPDGSCISDYIHVQDLADAYIVALQYLSKSDEEYEVFNIGTGQGSSVLELIHSFEEVTGVKVPYEIGDRREGDLPNIYANPEKAIQKLNWKTKRSEEHTSELQSRGHLVCRLLLEKKNEKTNASRTHTCGAASAL